MPAQKYDDTKFPGLLLAPAGGVEADEERGEGLDLEEDGRGVLLVIEDGGLLLVVGVLGGLFFIQSLACKICDSLIRYLL